MSSRGAGGVALGIDIGTTSVKVCALDDAGTLVATATSHHGIDERADAVQADADGWWASVRRALDAIGADLDLGRVRGIGLSGNMSSVVLLGPDGAPHAPVLLLADSRGGDRLAALPAQTCAAIAAATGNEPRTVFSLASLLWWQATEPATMARTSAWVSAKDDVRRRLTGEVSTDPTDAYNSLLLTDGAWDEALVTAVGLDPGIFPRVRRSDERAGDVTAAAAAATGLPVGVPVATGSGDVASALAGLGGLADDVLAVSLGTSVTLMAGLGEGSRPSLPARAQGALTVHPAADGSWFALGSLLTGGLALNWLRSQVGPEAVAAAPSVLGADDPLHFLPYLAGTGSPDFVPDATGTILGIRTSTTAPQIATALFESIAFDLADLVERIGGEGWDHVVVSGGGGRIGAWPQIVADVLGLRVSLVADSDLSALGAAVHGWCAAGRRVAPALTTSDVAPRAGTASAWTARRRRHVAARAALIDLGTAPRTGQNGRQSDDPHRHR